MTKSLRSVLLAGVSSVALATAASAADMGPPTKAPVAVNIYNWAGFYIGVNGGVGRQNYSIDANDEGSSVSGSATGGMFGGQIGYNWRQRYWVYGVEVDEDWADLSNTSRPGSGGAVIPSVTISKVDSLGSARVRTGLAIEDTLVYATGGLAWGHVKNGWGDSYTVPAGTCCDVSSSKTRIGWVGGVGVEHMLDQHWTVRLEGLYYDLGRDTKNATITGTTYNSQFTNEVFVGRLGVNYKW